MKHIYGYSLNVIVLVLFESFFSRPGFDVLLMRTLDQILFFGGYVRVCTLRMRFVRCVCMSLFVYMRVCSIFVCMRFYG